MSTLEKNPFLIGKPRIIEGKNIVLGKIPELSCKSYGFDCSFSIISADVSKLIREFRKHTLQNHFIDYPEGVLMRFIMRKRFD